jgi:hypothetical protein
VAHSDVEIPEQQPSLLRQAARPASPTVPALHLGVDVRALETVRGGFGDRARTEIGAADAEPQPSEVPSLTEVEPGERILAGPPIEADDQDGGTSPGVADAPLSGRAAEEIHRAPRLTPESRSRARKA